MNLNPHTEYQPGDRIYYREAGSNDEHYATVKSVREDGLMIVRDCDREAVPVTHLNLDRDITVCRRFPLDEILPRPIKARDLRVGDVVSLGSWGPWVIGMVVRTDPPPPADGDYIVRYATMWRPYAPDPDYVYGGGTSAESVIPYIGVEEYPVPMNDAGYTLLRRMERKPS